MEWPTRRRLAVSWFAAAVMFVAVAAAVRASASGLDDPDAARQRSGVLTDAESPAPPVFSDALPGGGVVFFERGGRSGELCRALRGSTLSARALLVTTSEPAAACAARVVAVAARDAADGVGLPRPRDGGAPVGYAIVDATGRVRYATLDPGMADHLAEVRTMLRAATG